MAEERRVGNLPGETSRLVGRREELARVVRLCGRSRLVTVTGVGGVGKTRLARQVATALQPRFPDGAWWVELSPLSDGRVLPYAIGEALPLADQSTRPMLDVVAEYLAGRDALVVLDTCEHLVEECRTVVGTLLRAAPGLRVLATGRRALALADEEVFTLPPLPVPGDGDASAEDGDAVVLLAERAAEAVPGFAVTAADRGDLVALCRRLEGLPLAIELAAARLRQMPLADLGRRLADRFAVLGETRCEVYDADPPWHQALSTAIGWSHQLCTPAERLIWARLSVFAGSFGAEAAGQVCADEHLPAEEVPALLTALTEKSILTWQPTGAGDRYRMLDTIREFGAHWLRELGGDRAVRHRHRDHHLALARAAGAAWIGPRQTDWYDRTVAEHANFRAALDACLTEGDGHGALGIGGALGFFWYACGFPKEGQHYLDRALALPPPPSSPPSPDAHRIRATALWARGLASIAQGDGEATLRLAGELRKCVAGEPGGADGTAALATAYLESCGLVISGRPTRAAEVLDATPRARPAGGRHREAWFLLGTVRGFVHVLLGHYAEASAVTDDLCAECARHGETWIRAWGDYIRALATLALGRADEAAAHARTALRGKHRLHDSLGVATSLDVLASATVASGSAEQAARLLGVAERIWRAIGVPQAGQPELLAARRACEERARGLVGDDAYESAFLAGHDADPAIGIAYALTAPDTLRPIGPPDLAG